MSKAVGGFGLFRAQRDAALVLDRIRPHVVRAEVAGSVRRQRALVHDVDLVVELDQANPWVMRRIEHVLVERIGELGASGHPALRVGVLRLRFRLVKEGPSIVSFVQEVPFGPNLDLYVATAATWGITLLIRTGSAAHNIRLVEKARHMLPARKLAVSRGLVDTADQVVASRTEEEIFDALGMGFVPPSASGGRATGTACPGWPSAGHLIPDPRLVLGSLALLGTKALALAHLRIRHDRSFHAIPDLDELLKVHRVLHEVWA